MKNHRVRKTPDKTPLKELISIVIGISFLFFSLLAGKSSAEYSDSDNSSTNMHSFLEQKGISMELIYTGEYSFIPSGGIERKSDIFLDSIDLTFLFNTEYGGLWKGGSFFVYLLATNHNPKPSKFVGDLQGTSNIEKNDSARVYEFWYEQSLFDDKLSLLFGLHDLNSEFNITEYGALYLNNSFGIGPDISVNLPVSTFPVTSPALKLKLAPFDWITFNAGIYDGNPGNPDKNRGFNIRIDDSEEGFMSIFEFNFIWGAKDSFFIPQGIFKTGLWHHSGNFKDNLEVTTAGSLKTHTNNTGFYFIMDQVLFRENEKQGLGFFVQYGLAPEDRNEVDNYFGIGFNYTGLLPGRDEDTIGLALARAHISEDLVEAETSNGKFRRAEEIDIELTYYAPVYPWFAIHPDIQVVFAPGGDKSVKTATIYTLRFETTF